MSAECLYISDNCQTLPMLTEYPLNSCEYLPNVSQMSVTFYQISDNYMVKLNTSTEYPPNVC